MCPSLPSVQERPVVVAVTEVLSGCQHIALAVCPQDVWDVCWASRAMNCLNFVWLGELLGECPQLKGTQTRKWNWGSACSLQEIQSFVLSVFLRQGTTQPKLALNSPCNRGDSEMTWSFCLSLLSAQIIGMCTIPGFYWHFKLNLGFPACTLSILLCLISHLRSLEKASIIGCKDRLSQDVWGHGCGTRGG